MLMVPCKHTLVAYVTTITVCCGTSYAHIRHATAPIAHQVTIFIHLRDKFPAQYSLLFSREQRVPKTQWTKGGFRTPERATHRSYSYGGQGSTNHQLLRGAATGRGGRTHHLAPDWCRHAPPPT